ncbi:helix-turn-helix domain-containing protein [Nocardioides sp. NPDC051685]|uniref:helix-turn-helix domain-containing protein n=1 Tax=Nocardioides sp. NPDC051685 TaxID=3364334 RepID=UPI00379A068E
MTVSASSQEAIPPGAQTLARGLAILEYLVESGAPVTATEIAAQSGTHQSSASRLLKGLITAGYVRKVRGKGFAPDVGVFSLAANTAKAFAPTEETQRAMRELSRQSPHHIITLGALWDETLVHLYRVSSTEEPFPLSVSSMPLHLSSHALIALIQQPENEALMALEHSRARFGWARPTRNIPPTEAEVLALARESCEDDILILDDWSVRSRRATCIRIDAPWGPAALTYLGGKGLSPRPKMRKLARESAMAIEATFH